MKVKVINTSKHALPAYETSASAGMDLRANLSEDVIIKPLERQLIPTGLFIELPAGYEAQIRPRSGLAIKYGITLLNTPGTIDADYRGEIKLIMVNLSNQEFVIKDGDALHHSPGDLVLSESARCLADTPDPRYGGRLLMEQLSRNLPEFVSKCPQPGTAS